VSHDDVWREIFTVQGQRVLEHPSGIMEVHFANVVNAEAMKALAEHAIKLSSEQGVEHPCLVSVVDLSALDSFTTDSRKVFGAINAGGKRQVDFIVCGASVRSKALFGLVLTATKLLGDVRFDVIYADSLEQARAEAVKRRALRVAEGKMKPA
jgi:hypothetical protein